MTPSHAPAPSPLAESSRALLKGVATSSSALNMAWSIAADTAFWLKGLSGLTCSALQPVRAHTSSAASAQPSAAGASQPSSAAALATEAKYAPEEW